MKKTSAVLFIVTLLASAACAGDLTFITRAANDALGGAQYNAYIDLSTKHMDGTYTSVKLISIYDQPVTAGGFKGVKKMVNTFEIDCGRNVKRVLYIGFLDSNDKLIVDQAYPNAQDEGFGQGTVDTLVKPYLCK
jgi:hypothetical protein